MSKAHNHFMIPPPPVSDAVLFRSSVCRTIASYAATAVFAWLLVAGFYVGLTVLLGKSVGHVVDFVLSPLFVSNPVIICSVLLGMLLRSPHWVRVSAAGVEIGTTYARSVLVPWSDVESATARGRSVLAILDIVPHETAMTSLQDGKGRLPRMRVRGGRRGYYVRAGLFPGGPGAAIGALRTHGVPQAGPLAPRVGTR